MGDRGDDFGVRRRGQGTEREPSDGGRRLVASEPVEKGCEDSQGVTDKGDVARVVVVADGQSLVIQRGRLVAVLGLELGQIARQL